MLIFILLSLPLLAGVVWLTVWLGARAVLLVRDMARRGEASHLYPTAQMMEATYQSPPPGVWPPPPEAQLPEIEPTEQQS